jgi:hypothetical protein
LSSQDRADGPIAMLMSGAHTAGAAVMAASEVDARPARYAPPPGASDSVWPTRRRLRIALAVHDSDHVRRGVVAVHEPLERLGGLSMVFCDPEKESMYVAYVDCDSTFVSVADVRTNLESAGFRAGEPQVW